MAQKTLTANGAAKIVTAQSKFGGASGSFDGVDGTYVAVTDNADFNFGAGDFTIEFFARFNATAATYMFYGDYPTVTTRECILYWNTDNTLHFARSTDGSNNVDTAFAFTPATATWYHIAGARSGNTFKMFVDGTQVGANLDMTGITINTNTTGPAIGGENSAAHNNVFNGWIDEMRVSKGIARYTANFTAPTAAFGCGQDTNTVLLAHMDGTDQSTTFTDDSVTKCAASGNITLLGVG